jgi:protein-tyrosine phosphatase
MAALVLGHELRLAGQDGITVASAGTGGWHVGDPADRRAQAALRRRGYPTEHRAQQFRPEWFDAYDLVIAMDRDNQRDLRRLAPSRTTGDAVRLMLEFDPEAEGLDVPDPYYGGAADFDDVLGQIESACRGLFAHLTSPPVATA